MPMSHHHSKDPHPQKKIKPAAPQAPAANSFAPEPVPTLSLVLKSDTDGCEQAVCELISHNPAEGVPIEIIHKGVGDICKNDIMTASTGSGLILGFNVAVLPKLAELCQEQNVEIRLYSVIYKLQEDLREIAQSLLPQEADEKILGRAKVIALFKGSRRGIILGCEVEDGRLQKGDRFRIISAMGPVYSDTITSLHIETSTVNKAMPGQQVGIKIDDFKTVHQGDLVECYQTVQSGKSRRWQSSGKILQR
jgi:translation initiation factor IF-2